jgi:heat-inducible transcriptional repressor
MLMVLTLDGGLVRTVFVEVPGEIADSALGAVTAVLNQRLAGLTLGQIRGSLPERLRDTVADPTAAELLNIFVQEGEQLFEAALPASDAQPVLFGSTSALRATQFSAADRLRRPGLPKRRTRSGETMRKRARPESRHDRRRAR